VIGVTKEHGEAPRWRKHSARLSRFPGGDGAIEKVLDATEGRGADVVIETTGMLRQWLRR